MPLFSFRIPLRQTARIADALERIADILELFLAPDARGALQRRRAKVERKPPSPDEVPEMTNERAYELELQEMRDIYANLSEEDREKVRKGAEEYRG